MRSCRERGGTRRASEQGANTMTMKELRQSPTMARLLDALDQGQDIGHYGLLTVAMVGNQFLEKDELLKVLERDPKVDEREAKSLVQQVASRDYNPPSRQTLLDWQQHQDFPIIEHPEDPNAGNLYRELQMPDDDYEDIENYREQQFDVAMDQGDRT
jgi:hypothetical protein